MIEAPTALGGFIFAFVVAIVAANACSQIGTYFAISSVGVDYIPVTSQETRNVPISVAAVFVGTNCSFGQITPFPSIFCNMQVAPTISGCLAVWQNYEVQADNTVLFSLNQPRQQVSDILFAIAGFQPTV